MAAKLWHITGYIGNSDWDGPEDNNIDEYIVFDKRFSKEEVVNFMLHYFKKYRVIYIKAEENE